MFNRAHQETEVWRLFILRRNASELLVIKSEAGFDLPCVETPTHGRIALALNAQVRALWNLDVYSLYPVPAATSGHASSRYHVVEALQYEAVIPRTGQWLPICSVTADHFVEYQDFEAIETWTISPGRRYPHGRYAPFEKPGWFFDVRDWVQDAIRPFQLKLTGTFQQFNASSSFSLIRFETDAGAVWFKAVGHPNEREFPLTVLLSNHLSTFTPRVLATELQWNAWLTSEVPGLRLTNTQGLAAWKNAARDLARMQIASIDLIKPALSGDLRNVRIAALLAQVEPFFECLSDLMDRQTTDNPARLSIEDLAQLKADTNDALLELQQEGVPDSLGHLDLHPENIIALPGRTVFLDWAEGSVGHPFFSLAYLLEHFRASSTWSDEAQACLTNEYAAVWESSYSIKNLDALLRVSTFLAVFAHAVSGSAWGDLRKLEQPPIAGYYRSLARHMKRYSDRIHASMSRASVVSA